MPCGPTAQNPTAATAPTSSYSDRRDLHDMPTYRLRHTLSEHTRAVASVRFRSDGQRVVSASADGTAIIWRTDTGEVVHRLVGHGGGLSDVTWSRDGRMVATASDDNTLRLWDAEHGTCLRILRGHTHYAFCCCFSAAGNLLASGSFDETIRVWDVHTGRCIKVIPGHSDPVTSVHFCNDQENPLLASASFDGISRIWHASYGRCLKSLVDGHNHPMSFVRFTPNARFVLTSSLDPISPALCLWDYNAKKVKKTYSGHTNLRFSLQAAFVVNDPDHKKYVVSGSEDHHVYIWDLNTRTVAGLLRGRRSADAPGEGHSDVVLSVDATEGAGVPPLIASCGMDSTVKIWEHVSARRM